MMTNVRKSRRAPSGNRSSVFSRVVKVGSRIYVTGTTALGEDGQIVCVDNPYEQANIVHTTFIANGLRELAHVLQTGRVSRPDQLIAIMGFRVARTLP
jgi:hypothetical protein